jgi:molybdopterin/thiamine biosynthesis adenylyltransferase
MGSSSEISPNQLAGLLKGRKFGVNQIDSLPSLAPTENSDDLQELQSYCQKMGIIGLSCTSMNAKAMLRMIKAKMGDRSSINEISKKQVLHG